MKVSTSPQGRKQLYKTACVLTLLTITAAGIFFATDAGHARAKAATSQGSSASAPCNPNTAQDVGEKYCDPHYPQDVGFSCSSALNGSVVLVKEEMKFTNLKGQEVNDVAILRLWYSMSCGTNWAQIVFIKNITPEAFTLSIERKKVNTAHENTHTETSVNQLPQGSVDTVEEGMTIYAKQHTQMLFAPYVPVTVSATIMYKNDDGTGEKLTAAYEQTS